MMKGAVAALAAIGMPSPATFAITPSKTVKGVFVSNDMFIPEMWARESLKILEENMMVGEIVHRDFGCLSDHMKTTMTRSKRRHRTT
jgi:hypothetical protein